MNNFRKTTHQPYYQFIFITLFLLMTGLNIKAQDGGREGLMKTRKFIGGNLGLQFGSITLLDVSPYFGYRLTNSWSVGTGLTYQYFRDGRGEPTYSSNIYGGRIFTSYHIIPAIFAYAEYEVLNIEVPVGTQGYTRKNINSAFIGGGYRQMIGPKLYSDIMILWNLTESADSPYQNPVYRLGLVIGL